MFTSVYRIVSAHSLVIKAKKFKTYSLLLNCIESYDTHDDNQKRILAFMIIILQILSLTFVG